MNKLQKKILIGAAIVFSAMLIFPPYNYVWNGNVLESGYAFLFDLPNQATVDVAMLGIQWVGVLIVAGIAFVLVRDQ